MRETSEQIAERVHATLPDYLKQSKEEIAAGKKEMQLRAASFTRSKLTDAERLISEGRVHEEIARANLETMQALRDAGKNNSAQGGANLEMVAQELIRLAHGLERQGRYKDAAEAHPLKRERTRLLKINEAIERDDAEVCNCPADKVEINGKRVEVHPFYEVKKIFSRKHGKAVSLVGCSKCSDLNATPTPPEQLARILNAVNLSDVHVLK